MEPRFQSTIWVINPNFSQLSSNTHVAQNPHTTKAEGNIKQQECWSFQQICVLLEHFVRLRFGTCTSSTSLYHSQMTEEMQDRDLCSFWSGIKDASRCYWFKISQSLTRNIVWNPVNVIVKCLFSLFGNNFCPFPKLRVSTIKAWSQVN